MAAAASGASRAPGPVAAFDGLPASAMADLAASQDAYNELKMGLAQSLAAQVIAQWPDHPLPRIFLQGALLVEIQEAAAGKAVDPSLYTRFKQDSNEAVRLAEE